MADYNSIYTGEQIDEGIGNALAQPNKDAAQDAEIADVKSAIQQITTKITVGPSAVATFDTGDTVLPLKSLLVSIKAAQAGSGDPSPENIRPITGVSICNIYVSPTTDAQDGSTKTIYLEDLAGTVYEGTLDVTGRKLTVTHVCKKLKELSWVYQSQSVLHRFYCQYPSPLPKAAVDNGTAANGLKAEAYITGPLTWTSETDPHNWSVGINTSSSIFIRDTRYTNVSAFLKAMGDTRVLYELAEPIVYNLPETEIITLAGINNIWSDAGNVTVTFSRYTVATNESFYQNISIQRMYDAPSATSYIITRINKKRLDGRMQYPFVRHPAKNISAYELAINENWCLVSNASYSGKFIIQNGINVSTLPLEQGRRPLLVSETGDLSALDLEQWTDSEGVPPGCVSAVTGWGPLVIDYEDYTDDDQYHDDAGGNVTTIRCQRQIIGQYSNGDYCFLTCEGRNFDNSAGWTYEDARRVIKSLGLKFAYNLDGGGSTQIVVGRKNLNLVYEGTYGRQVPNLLVFNGSDSYNMPD